MDKHFFLLTASVLCISFFISCGSTSSPKRLEESEKKKTETQLVGNDRDEHGCIRSAGYQWSELLKDCIRPFEKGIQLTSAKGNQSLAAFLVFSDDSSKVEVFLPTKDTHQILTRENETEDELIWSGNTNSQISVRCIENIWGIYSDTDLLYVNLENK